MRELTDAELVQRFVALVQPQGAWTQAEAAERLSRIAGETIHQTTVSRWVGKGAKRLESHTRLAIEELLRGGAVDNHAEGTATEGDNNNHARPPSTDELAWLPRLIEKVVDHPHLTGPEKSNIIAELNAAAMRYWAVSAEWAAAQRGIAMIRAEKASEVRAWANGRAEDSAKERAGMLLRQRQQPTLPLPDLVADAGVREGLEGGVERKRRGGDTSDEPG